MIKNIFAKLTLAFSIVFLLLATCSISFAQNDRYFNINSFEKGLNSHVTPYSMQPSQCSEAQNVRFNSRYGALAKRAIILEYGDVGAHALHGMHRYYKASGTTKLIVGGSTFLYVGNDTTGALTVIHEGLTDSKTWQSVTYHDIDIWTNGYDNILKYDGYTQTTANTDGSRTASNLCADLGAPFAELNTGADLDASSWYQYKIAYYDGTNYCYSTKKSNAILTGAAVKNIRLIDIPVGEAGTTHRYIYRTVGNATKVACLANTTYYLVGTLADNSTAVYNDTTSDDDADDDSAPTWATSSAGSDISPPKGTLCVIHKERLFVAGDKTDLSNMYFSDEYNPDYFDPNDVEVIQENDGDKITFIKEQLGILTVAKTNSIQKYYTEGSEDDWYTSAPITHTGCYASYSAANTPLGIVYLARSGLYRFNGGGSELISDAVTPEIEDISPTNIDRAYGHFHGTEYMLAYTSKESGATTNNRILIYDITRDAYTIDYRNINVFTSFNSGSDYGTLYSADSTTGGKIWNHEGEVTNLIQKTKSDFNSGTFDDARVYGDENSPTMELAWDITIDEAVGTIDAGYPTAIIDRPDTDGSWTSPVYEINVAAFDKLYWNEDLGTTGNVTFKMRTGATSAACSAAAWSSAFSDPSGSDISGITANSFVQIKIDITTSNILYTPTLFVSDGYLFKLVYSVSGTTQEDDYLSKWVSGWSNFGVDNYPKIIQKIKIFYEGTSGDLVISYKNNEGDIDYSFTIDLSVDPNTDLTDDYKGSDDNKYYTYLPEINSSSTPSPIGRFWKITVSEEGVTEWQLNRIEIMYKAMEDNV